MKAIINGSVFYKGTFHKDLVVLYEERIMDVLDVHSYDQVLMKEPEMEVLDAGGGYVVPGFIDVHIHGYMGHDTMDAKAQGIQTIGKGICENGVTAFLPTTMTMAREAIIEALDNVAEQKDNPDYEGAEILGVHLEGPFINVSKKGAQPGEHVILPDQDLLETYKELIKVVTIAPEVEGAMDTIARFKEYMRFSLGHTAATYEQASAAYEAGAMGTTHLFNAMTGLHHREPGVVGASLSCDCYAEVIADGIHVNPGLFKLLVKAKGLERLLLITDCMRAGGLGEGDYTLGGQAVKVEKGKCTLKDGTIAGSVLKLNEGLRNFRDGYQKLRLTNFGDGHPANANKKNGHQTILGTDTQLTKNGDGHPGLGTDTQLTTNGNNGDGHPDSRGGHPDFGVKLSESLAEVLPLVTINQAEYLGVADEMGTLDKGKKANITLMDEGFNIQTTIVKGKKIYENHL